jgi:hypothetical protein
VSYNLRRNGALALVIVCIIIAGVVWTMNPISQQNEIGILLSAELVGFSMITYLYTRPSDEAISELWLLIGMLALAFLIGMATL